MATGQGRLDSARQQILAFPPAVEPGPAHIQMNPRRFPGCVRPLMRWARKKPEAEETIQPSLSGRDPASPPAVAVCRSTISAPGALPASTGCCVRMQWKASCRIWESSTRSLPHDNKGQRKAQRTFRKRNKPQGSKRLQPESATTMTAVHAVRKNVLAWPRKKMTRCCFLTRVPWRVQIKSKAEPETRPDSALLLSRKQP